jgi:hypothetical protein
MSTIYSNVLSNEEVDYLNNLPEVLAAKASLDSVTSGKVSFSINVTNTIRDTLQSRFGLNVSSIPMRWIKGDTAPHVDRGASHFENTYLVYLNDSPGEFVIDSQSYPIETNTGFMFNEGLSHKTCNTENVPRLLLGPMNEFAQPVGGGPSMNYYATEADALAQANLLANNTYGGYSVNVNVALGFNLIFPNLPYASWRIASNSIGLSSQSVVYVNGDTLDSTQVGGLDPVYYVYPVVPCFLEGSKILCEVDGVETYVPVEELKNGTLVKTSLDGYKKVVLIGKGSIQNPGNDERIENRLYKCSPSKYPQLKEDLYITGCHSILEFPITEKQKEDTIKHLGRMFITDNKYRLLACVDERAEPWNSEGSFVIWHFALENENDGLNYGVYANGGLLVETCSIRFLKNKSNMVLNV